MLYTRSDNPAQAHNLPQHESDGALQRVESALLVTLQPLQQIDERNQIQRELHCVNNCEPKINNKVDTRLFSVFDFIHSCAPLVTSPVSSLYLLLNSDISDA